MFEIRGKEVKEMTFSNSNSTKFCFGWVGYTVFSTIHPQQANADCTWSAMLNGSQPGKLVALVVQNSASCKYCT